MPTGFVYFQCFTAPLFIGIQIKFMYPIEFTMRARLNKVPFLFHLIFWFSWTGKQPFALYDTTMFTYTSSHVFTHRDGYIMSQGPHDHSPCELVMLGANIESQYLFKNQISLSWDYWIISSVYQIIIDFNGFFTKHLEWTFAFFSLLVKSNYSDWCHSFSEPHKYVCLD